jgi:uncharacterized delta-60 repeat protein
MNYKLLVFNELQTDTIMKRFLLMGLILLTYLPNYAQNAGELDNFLNTDAANNFVTVTAIQSDGKILIGGGFTNYNGVARNGIARLNADGSLDNSFNPGGGANVAVYSLVIQPDGKILIGGVFTSYNGISRRRIARINSDGSLDTGFNPGNAANDEVYAIALQPDGKVLLGGKFNNFNGFSRNGIVRLNSDGSLDNTFNPITTANSRVNTVAVQPDGKILIGGDFGGVIIIRLNADGSLDGSFTIGVGYDLSFSAAYASSIALQPDGSILVGGNFIFFNGLNINRIVRLDSGGNIDFNFYFNSGNGVDSPFSSANFIPSVSSVALQSDGKILLGGLFTSYNNENRFFITRINSDGSLDYSFDVGSGATSIVNSFAFQSDGKILVGGYFTYYNGENKNRIARLNPDGSIDNNFNPGSGVDAQVSAIALQPDGKILLGGAFKNYNNKFTSESRNRIVRLNRDGSLDNSFNAGDGANAVVYSLALQPDGKILLAGSFSSINGVNRNRIARLNADGSLDNTFNPASGTNNLVAWLTLQPDGKILLGGFFTNVNGANRSGIARLNSDGSLDTSFNPGSGVNNYIAYISLQSDAKILIGGAFTSYNGINRNRIARLNANGSLDNSFNPGSGANGFVNTLSLQLDGKILIGGGFTSYNDVSRNRIARLNKDGSLDNTFNPGSGANENVYSLALQSDGKILLGGDFTSYNGIRRNRIIRLNEDGSADNIFLNRDIVDNNFNPGGGANNSVFNLAVQPDGRVLLGGTFTNYNGKAHNRIARIYCAPPQIPSPNIASEISSTSFKFNWASILGINQYEVDVSNDNFVTFLSGYQNTFLKDTTLTVNGLTPGTNYQYRLRALNEQGASLSSITLNVLTLPAKPISIAASSINQTGFIANWQAVNGASNYLLDVSEKADFSNFLTAYQNRSLNLTGEQINGLKPNTIYYYRVRAVNISGNSDYSNIITVVTLPATPLANLATNIGTAGFTANWQSVGSGNNIKYLLEVSNDNFVTLLPNFQNPITAITLTISGLNEGTIYQYRVRAINDAGLSSYSNTIQVGTLLNLPTNLKINEALLNKITIAWDDKSNVETGYEIQRSNFSGTNYATLVTTNAGVTSYTDIAVLPNTQYFYRVRAVKNSDNLFSNFSNEANATTPQDPNLIVPNAPSQVIAQAIAINQINLSWQDNSSNENSFVIESSVGNPNSFQVIASVSANTTTYNHSGLTSGTTYFYRIRALNNGGGSAYSAIIGGTTVDDNIVTANEALLLKSIQVFPNPTDNQLFIRMMNTNLPKIQFSLINQWGQLLIRGDLNAQYDTILNLSNYNSGIYFLQLNAGKSQIIKKVVKN